MATLIDTNDVVGRMQQIAQSVQYNNATEQYNAAQQQNWAERMWQRQADYNAAEALKNRNWQEYMSNTAHQREVQDLRAAGLNPILSAMGGNGAAVTSGATASSSVPSGSKADTDQSGTMAIVSLLNGMLQAQTSLQAADISARTQEAVADKYTAMEQLVAQLNQETAYHTADINRQSAAYVSDNSLRAAQATAGATVYAANRNYDTQEMVQQAQRDIAKLNADTTLTKAQREYEYERILRQTYPQTYMGGVAALLQTVPNFAGSISAEVQDYLDTKFGNRWVEVARQMLANGEITRDQFDAVTGATSKYSYHYSP